MAEFKGQYMTYKAKPCPFCGWVPILVPWHGGGPKKRMVMCYENQDCPVSPKISGETEAKALKAWNTRA